MFNKFLVLLSFLACLLAHSVFANSEGNIGVTYNQIIDDRAGGFVGDFKHNFGAFDFEADGQLQVGDIYRGKARTAVIFDVRKVGIKVGIETVGKGYTLDTMGSAKDISVALTVPTGNLNFDVGIGGSNSSPWGAPNAQDELEAKGYDINVLEELGLANVHPKPRGIPFQSGNFLNVFVATGLDVGSVEVDLKGIVQVAGEGDRQHQLQTYFQTSRDLLGIAVTVGLEIAFAHYQEAIHYETAILTSFGIGF